MWSSLLVLAVNGHIEQKNISPASIMLNTNSPVINNMNNTSNRPVISLSAQLAHQEIKNPKY
jgi:hypothetical protein